MDDQAFYTQIGPGQFDSSQRTAGPWSPDSQRGGPPSALVARELERYQPRDGHRLARVSIDILTPVPVAPLHISVEEIRTGKRVQLLQASAQAGGSTVLIGRAWARPRVALVAGEPMTPWQRVLTVGDSGSGISACAPPAQHPAINCDFAVVLHRDPVGDWIGMDSRTCVTPGQGALAQTTVFDAAGVAGLATQTLVV